MVNAVEMRGIVKRFPGVLANDRVNFDLRTGEIHALLGENGAGKSTLMNILAGLYRQEEGTIRVHDQPVSFRSPRAAIEHGIGMVHQHFMLVAKIWQLSVGEQQRVEILKMLYRGADVLIMDEPTAVLAPQEVDDLFVTLRSMTAEGKSIVFISHKLHEVMTISDRITVLRKGRMAAEPLETRSTNQAELAELMVGRKVIFTVTKEPREPGQVLLSVENVCAESDKGLPALKDVSFHQRAARVHVRDGDRRQPDRQQSAAQSRH